MNDPNMSDPEPPAFRPPFDQLPVDQQPLPPRQDDGANVAVSSGPPLIPPLQTTSPIDFVDAATHPAVTVATVASVTLSAAWQTNDDPLDFVPLRSDPPPALVPTWWLRSAVVVFLCVVMGAMLWTEYQGASSDVVLSAAVWAAHGLAGMPLLLWSYLAMGNVGRIVPGSRYQRRPSGSMAVVLWLLAAAAPFGVIAVARWLDERLNDSEDLAAVTMLVATVFVGLGLIWLPFGYHSRQASRVGAPHRVMLRWFFAPVLSGVGALVVVSVWLGGLLAADGLETSERLLQAGVVYAVPMSVFVFSTWRAITVFDEVIDLRWRRWRAEWEQTLGNLAALPVPGPENSPEIDNVHDS